MSEKWRSVVGYEGWYEVSDRGRVRRSAPEDNTWVGRIRKTHQNYAGYHSVILYARGKAANHFIHRLVAAAFIGPRSKGLQVHHINGDKVDNRPSNLTYVTGQENMDQATCLRGESHPRARIDADVVRGIRLLAAHGWPQWKIAFAYGVSPSCIAHVSTGYTWSHVA